MRAAAYRVFVLLCVVDGEWARGGLAEMYRYAWKQLKRGYP